MNTRHFERILEKVQVLTGERGEADKIAVRRGDLRIRPMRSGQIAAAPTATDFNRLQADVAALYAMLAAMQG